MEASGSSSHQVSGKETMVSNEKSYLEPVYIKLIIGLMNPPL